MGFFNFAYNRDTTIGAKVLKKLVLTIVALSCSTSAFAQSHQALDDLFYFSGTPPMTRLNRACVQIRIDNNRAVLYIDTTGKNNKLTESKAEKALGAPETFSGAQYCTQEELEKLGLSKSESKELRTYKFNLHTRENCHYSLLFLGQQDNLEFWRLLKNNASPEQDKFETSWAKVLNTTNFVAEEFRTLPERPDLSMFQVEPTQRKTGTYEEFLRGEIDHYIGVDIMPRYDRRKSPYPELRRDK